MAGQQIPFYLCTGATHDLAQTRSSFAAEVGPYSAVHYHKIRFFFSLVYFWCDYVNNHVFLTSIKQKYTDTSIALTNRVPLKGFTLLYSSRPYNELSLHYSAVYQHLTSVLIPPYHYLLSSFSCPILTTH